MFWSALVDQCRLIWDFTGFSAEVSLLGASQNWLCSGHCRGMLRNNCCVGPREEDSPTPDTLLACPLCVLLSPLLTLSAARKVWEKNGNQYYSALHFAMEKGRIKNFLVSNAASSPLWKEAVQVLCCPGSCRGLPGICLRHCLLLSLHSGTLRL